MTKRTRYRNHLAICSKTNCSRGDICNNFCSLPRKDSVPFPSCNYWFIEESETKCNSGKKDAA